MLVRLVSPTLLIMKALTTECYSIMFISTSNILTNKVVSYLSLLFSMLGVSNNNTLIIQLSHIGLSAKHQTYAGTGPSSTRRKSTSSGGIGGHWSLIRRILRVRRRKGRRLHVEVVTEDAINFPSVDLPLPDPPPPPFSVIVVG